MSVVAFAGASAPSAQDLGIQLHRCRRRCCTHRCRGIAHELPQPQHGLAKVDPLNGDDEVEDVATDAAAEALVPLSALVSLEGRGLIPVKGAAAPVLVRPASCELHVPAHHICDVDPRLQLDEGTHSPASRSSQASRAKSP